MKIFQENESYRPFFYPWAVEGAKKQAIDMFWDVHQVDLQDDIRQYNSKDGLKTPNCSHERNKKLVDDIAPLFTELDRKVAEGYVKLLPFTKNNEILVLFIEQAQKETVHQRAYALAGETFGFTDGDWVAFQEYKAMREKIDVMTEGKFDLNQPLDYAKALTQVLLGEGIGLFSAFTSLLNLKRFGLLMGFNDVNQWSLADETAHVENNIRVVRSIFSELTYAEQLELKQFTLELIEKFVNAEILFIELLYEAGEQEDLTKVNMIGYIEYLGKLRAFQLGYITFSEVPKNPLEWMDFMLSAGKHENFFEKRVTSYSHNKLKGDVDYSKYQKLLAERII